jgi:addiction module HigA family antidote
MKHDSEFYLQRYRVDMEKLKNIHPGEVLKIEFLDALGISAYRLAKATFIPQTRISQIVAGKRRVSVDTALRFSKFFGNSAHFWIQLQSDYDLELESDLQRETLDKIQPLIQ